MDDGRLDIRKIVAHVKKFLDVLDKKDGKPKVTVVYFLVCSEGVPRRKWTMSLHWNKDLGADEHPGDVFYLFIPVSIVLPAES